MANSDYIEKYKDIDEIRTNYYQIKDKYGKCQLITGIVNPLKCDNRQIASMTDQQGSTPHCAAYSICNLAEAIIWKRTGKLINLNADQVYAHAKMIDGNPSADGTYLEMAIKAAVKLGGFPNADKLKIGCVYNSNDNKLIEITKYLIHKYDFLHIGFNISTGWYACNESNPRISHTSVSCGGHAVLLVGYDQEGVYIQNSWGKEWGAKGFAIMPWSVYMKEMMYLCYIQNAYDDMHE